MYQSIIFKASDSHKDGRSSEDEEEWRKNKEEKGRWVKEEKFHDEDEGMVSIEGWTFEEEEKKHRETEIFGR